MTLFKTSLLFCCRRTWVFCLSIGLLPGTPAFSQDRSPVSDTSVVVDTVASDSTTAYLRHEEDTLAGQEKPDLYVARQLPDTMVQRWMRDPAMSYANDPRYWQKKPREERKPDGFSLGLARLLVSQGFR
ncbi:MAG TPA: hypothetical protein VI233_00575, partial [Puia sp.]